MAITTASLTAAITATTAAANAEDKMTALLNSLAAAYLKEIGAGMTITPQQRSHYEALKTEAAANVADFVTANTVA